MSGVLYLLPNVLAEEAETSLWLPAGVEKAVNVLHGLIAESEKGGRKFLSRWQLPRKLQEFKIEELNEHSPKTRISELLLPLKQGESWGIVSDAGLPCIADPGSDLVFQARAAGITVKALAGPSSVTLALMLSGLPAQRFSFNGYLERKMPELTEQLIVLEKRSSSLHSTQVFIEAPYRSLNLLRSCLEVLSSQTILACASELTGPQEEVVVKSIAQWRKDPLPDLHKKRAIFLLYKKSD